MKEEFMNSAKSFQSLEPLIHSNGGLHFSAYIANYFGAPAIRSQLEEAIKVASEDLKPILSRDERKKFLKPLHALLRDQSTLSTIKGNIGIFRSQNFFRVLHIPVHVEEYSTVASSFHVKPLLRWKQEDRAFRLLVVSDRMSCLYSGTQHSLRPMDTFISKKQRRLRSLESLSKFWRKVATDAKQENLKELLIWVEEKLTKDSEALSPPLYIVGSEESKEFLVQQLSDPNIRRMDETSSRDLAKAVAKIRASLREESDKTIKEKLSDFAVADALDMTESNLFKIAKAAEQGLVKKLIVAADRKLFGKLSAKSGKLTLHQADIDHEDEDVLDDIAQKVVRRGGEVFVSPIRKIPGQRPALAISVPEYPAQSSNRTRWFKNSYKELKFI